MGALCTLLAALVTVEQQSGRAATMGLLLTYALQVRALLWICYTCVQRYWCMCCAFDVVVQYCVLGH
jgi:hypothetical protein